MNWLRENWFDALLFVLLAAVVAAIVLFLTGVNPFARRPQPVVEPVTTTDAPPPPQAEAASPEPETGTGAEAPAGGVTVLPLPPAIEAEPTAGEVEPEPVPGKPAEVTPPPRPQPQVAPAGQGRYRVSVGAFTRPEYAVDLAKKLEAGGYPVRIEVIGRVSRVVVGPYVSRAEAERARAALSRYEPQIYKGDTPLPQGRYLQVGAFKNLDRARTLAKALKDAGYPVAVYYREGWAKVWVGPLEETQVAATRAKLEAEGYQPVEVRDGG